MTIRLSLANDGTTEAEAVANYLAATMPAGETVRFYERGVVLTEHHARLNFMIYPLKDISDLRLRKQPFSYSVIVALLGIGVISAFLTAYLFFFGTALALLGSSVILALALRFAVPSSYVLRLTLPSGEQDVLMARDKAYLQRVIAALNETYYPQAAASDSESIQLLESARNLAQILLNEAWNEALLTAAEAQVQALVQTIEQTKTQTRALGRARLLAVTLDQARVKEQSRQGEQIQVRGLERARALLEVLRLVEALVE